MERDSSHDVNDIDVEKAQQSTMSTNLNTVEFLEAAALLLLWSVLVINEGAIRFMETVPSTISETINSGTISPLVPLLGGVFEVFFGVLGLSVALFAFVARVHSPIATKLVMVLQTILGYYVFILFVFAVPAILARDLPADSLRVRPELSDGENRFLIVLGMLTSFHFCLALQGGQFVFMARLVAAATGTDFLKQQSGNQMRSFFWNGNLAFAGLWTLITGAFVSSKLGSRPAMPYISPPNVGTVSGLTVFVGLLMLAWGIFGIFMGLTRKAPSYYYLGTVIVYLFALLNFGIAQFGTFGGSADGGPVALHNGLSFLIVFLGPYFVRKTAEELN